MRLESIARHPDFELVVQGAQPALKYTDPEDMLTDDELLAFDRGDWKPKWAAAPDYEGSYQLPQS